MTLLPDEASDVTFGDFFLSGFATLRLALGGIAWPQVDASDSVEIRIRMDASAVDAELDAVRAFATALRARFFDPTTRVLLEPDPSSVTAALATSHAAAFSRSPRSILAGLAKDQAASHLASAMGRLLTSQPVPLFFV
jgi:hypothetical protein